MRWKKALYDIQDMYFACLYYILPNIPSDNDIPVSYMT